MPLTEHPLYQVSDLAPEDRRRLDQAAMLERGEWPLVEVVEKRETAVGRLVAFWRWAMARPRLKGAKHEST